MGIEYIIGLFGLCVIGVIALLVQEVLLLNETLERSKEIITGLHEDMAEKLSDAEIEKLHLENKISDLEETISLWQGKSRKLHQQVTLLTDGIGTDFEDEKTKESVIPFRTAA